MKNWVIKKNIINHKINVSQDCQSTIMDNYPTDRKNNNIIKLIWNKDWFKKGFLIVCHKAGKLQTNLRQQKLKKLSQWIFRLAGLVISNFKSFNKKKN